MSKMRPLPLNKPKDAVGDESQAVMSFDELQSKFLRTVSRVLAAKEVGIAPACRPHFTSFIDNGVAYLINSNASPREIAAAESKLRQFTLHTVKVARSRGKTRLDAQTLRISKTAGSWCPPFCGDEDE